MIGKPKKSVELVMAFIASVTGIFATDVKSPAQTEGAVNGVGKEATTNVVAKDASCGCLLYKFEKGTLRCNN